MATIVENLSKIIDIKEALKQEINAKGGEITDNTPFNQYPEEVKKIGGGDIVGLIERTATKIIIPESTTRIGRLAFAYCTNLEELVVPSSVTEIEDTNLDYNPFKGCTMIKRLDYSSPYTLSSNSTSAFSSQLIEVKLGEGVTMLGSSVFRNAQFTEINFPDSLDGLRTSVFYGCNKCLVFNFGNTRTTIPTLSNVNAFQSTNDSKKIVVPDALYDQWITATNWSSTTYNIKTSIVKYSDYYGS